MSSNVARRLRPYLFHGFQRTQCHRTFSRVPALYKQDDIKSVTHDYEKRIAELEAHRTLSECYPRLDKSNGRDIVPLDNFRRDWADLQADETRKHDGLVTVAGRVKSVRMAGNKLVFMDIDDSTGTIQVLCTYGQLQEHGVDVKQLKDFGKVARKGDWYTATGWPHKTSRGELSVLVTQLPTLVSPSLHQIPETLDDPETRARHRHVDMLVNRESTIPLLVRHHVEKHLNDFFHEHDFVKVNTPLLTHGAGGAVARPFETVATELEGQQLNLRIAPELWLKRLVVGGLTKVYEIGPAFRNEGVDATHNPEFSICEFYEAFATLEDLMQKTESLLSGLQTKFDKLKAGTLTGLPNLDIDLFGPYERLEFLPTLERELGQTIPDLSAPSAPQQLTDIFNDKNIPLPANPTLPRLLDALAAHYLEPLCLNPTFITHHPACLSPLSKYFPCPRTHQTIAARAEFFIRGREYANMYEEENSPFEQRRKFRDQLRYREVDGEGDGKGEIDESYIQALEWGLPPTGGWGCGIDRLAMLLSGRDRIADVLPFGTLRNVVALGKGRV
ncbi:mitochondrial lysine-tRNA synthetase [Recurvomyces mirabilis]|nr:mitochondrial lysine-tRNA synthetase [Recurvomyces mirabilis]